MMDFEDMLEHVCGFCRKIFKKEIKLDRHIKKKHSASETEEKSQEKDMSMSDWDSESMADKSEVKQEKDESDGMTNVKIRKIPNKYTNMYGFDPINRVWICASCGANFLSDRGIKHHLSVTRCGFGEKDDYKPKNDYKSLYMKEGGQLICCGCGTVYHSEHGMYYHLKITKCGFGDKDKPTPKKDFTPFYKVENNIHVCLVCDVNYDTIRGMHYHLNKKCGAEAKMKVFQPKPVTSEGQKKSPPGAKKNYKQFYRTEDNSTFTCLGCETVYYSSHGVHSHLNTTKCGFGDKFRSPPKTCYLQLYRKEGDQLVCLGCGKTYGSSRGVHHHLNNTRCGFGEKENGTPRRNYTSLYRKEDGVFTCKRCEYEVPHIYGIHRHLKKCVAGFLDELNTAHAGRKVAMDVTEVEYKTFTQQSVVDYAKIGIRDEVNDNDEEKEEETTVLNFDDYMDVPLE